MAKSETEVAIGVDGASVAADTRFAIASISKTFTTVLASWSPTTGSSCSCGTAISGRWSPDGGALVFNSDRT